MELENTAIDIYKIKILEALTLVITAEEFEESYRIVASQRFFYLSSLFFDVFYKCFIYIYAFIKQSAMNCIKDVLERKGIKQVWLAQQLGKSYNIVNGYAQNRSQPSIEVLYRIAEFLNVDPRDLLGKPSNYPTIKARVQNKSQIK